MGVFDGQTKVARKVKDAGTDRKLPGGAPPMMTSVALSSAADAIDAVLVHGEQSSHVTGNQWNKTDGNGDLHVLRYRHVEIGSNQTIEVGGDQTETIAGTSNETIIGPHIISNMNVFNETRMGAHIQAHGGIEWVHEDDTQFHSTGFNFSYTTEIVEVETFHNEAAAFHFEVKGQHNYFSANDNTAVLVQFQTRPLNVKADATDADIYGLQCEVMALGARCGMLEAHAVPLKANAGARVGIDSPFGG